jgi:hypothetical protein
MLRYLASELRKHRSSALKGRKHVSPGQRPGNAIQEKILALKGHNNRMAAFPQPQFCTALSGLRSFLNFQTQGVALGWYVVAPSGRSEKRNIKT